MRCHVRIAAVEHFVRTDALENGVPLHGIERHAHHAHVWEQDVILDI